MQALRARLRLAEGAQLLANVPQLVTAFPVAQTADKAGQAQDLEASLQRTVCWSPICMLHHARQAASYTASVLKHALKLHQPIMHCLDLHAGVPGPGAWLAAQVAQHLADFQQGPNPLLRAAAGQEAFCVPTSKAFLSAVLDSSRASLQSPGQRTRQPRGVAARVDLLSPCCCCL